MSDITFQNPPEPYLVPEKLPAIFRPASFSDQIVNFAWNEIIMGKQNYCLVKIGIVEKDTDATKFFVDQIEIKAAREALGKYTLVSKIVRDTSTVESSGGEIVYLFIAKTSCKFMEI